MYRPAFVALALLLFSTSAFAQTTSSDSQTLQSLLAEVRRLRQELQATTIAAQRAQILVYRLQAQEAATARAVQRLDSARDRLAVAQDHRKHLAAQIKQAEDAQFSAENPKDREGIEGALAQLKASLEASASEEQDRQSKETECENEVQSERAKLSELEDQLDRLDTALENSSRQPSSPR
jgi:hypothetical protein